MEIRDSQVVITGANRGIGKALAQMCAEDKAHLHLIVRKHDERLIEEMTNAGAASVKLYEVNLENPEEIHGFLKTISKVNVDILINNAGQMTGGPLEDQAIKDIYRMMQVNVNALIHLTRGILPGMLKNRRGKIINHSSISGVMSLPSESTYCASKAAVLAFTNSLHAELKGTGVSTLVLVTPAVDTRMFRDIPKHAGKNLDLSFLKPMPPHQYARMVREAILEDLSELKPNGLLAAGVLLAQHMPRVFENLVSRRFRRAEH